MHESTFEKLHVLVVDDSAIVRAAHRSALERLGCKVDLAEDGEQALELVKNSYDAIFLDLELPGMQGSDVAAEIRRREPPLRRMPIIGITTKADADSKRLCKAAGMDEVVPKPVLFDTLACLLQQWVQENIPPLK